VSARHAAKLTALVTLIVGVSLAVAGEGQPIHLRVSPAVSLSPATLVAQVHIQPDDSDRELTVVADGPDFYRRSSWTIEGRSSPKAYAPIFYRDLPPGRYVVQATVGSFSRIRATARADILVQ
jgi:hypothetical protein